MSNLDLVVNFFKQGGVFLYPIAAVFAVGVVIAVERFIYLLRVSRGNRKLWAELAPLLQAGNFRMAMAVAELMKNNYVRIILTRPAVEAGEKLGFLPGDLAEKVNPYLRPLYDALHDMVDFDRARKMVERGTIEVAPLAFMRGRTLNDSFVILDEAQNTTPEQMKMFLTRLGYGSKAVITGDATQIDLPAGKLSGLKEASRILKGVHGIRFITFTEKDVARHHLVQEIISAYERDENQLSARETLEKS